MQGCGLWVVGCGLWVVGCGLWFEVGCRGLRFGVCLLNDDGNILLMSHSLRYCTVMFLYLKRRGQDKGLGFGVCGLGFGVWGLWFVVWGLGFGVWGLGFGVWGLGFVVSTAVGVGTCFVCCVTRPRSDGSADGPAVATFMCVSHVPHV